MGQFLVRVRSTPPKIGPVAKFFKSKWADFWRRCTAHCQKLAHLPSCMAEIPPNFPPNLPTHLPVTETLSCSISHYLHFILHFIYFFCFCFYFCFLLLQLRLDFAAGTKISKLAKNCEKITFMLFSKLQKNYTKITISIPNAPLCGANLIIFVIFV